MEEQRPESGHPDVQAQSTTDRAGGGGKREGRKDSKDRQGYICITLQGDSTLTAPQASFLSVINSH